MSTSASDCPDCIRRIHNGEGFCPYHVVPVLEARVADLEAALRRIRNAKCPRQMANQPCPCCAFTDRTAEMALAVDSAPAGAGVKPTEGGEAMRASGEKPYQRTDSAGSVLVAGERPAIQASHEMHVDALGGGPAGEGSGRPRGSWEGVEPEVACDSRPPEAVAWVECPDCGTKRPDEPHCSTLHCLTCKNNWRPQRPTQAVVRPDRTRDECPITEDTVDNSATWHCPDCERKYGRTVVKGTECTTCGAVYHDPRTTNPFRDSELAELRTKLNLPDDAPIVQVIATIDNLQKLAALRMDKSEPRELHCEDCDRDYPTWCAPNELWNAVVREPENEAGRVEPFLCLTCFAMRAEKHGIVPTAWLVRPEARADYPRKEDVDRLCFVAWRIQNLAYIGWDGLTPVEQEAINELRVALKPLYPSPPPAPCSETAAPAVVEKGQGHE